MRVLRRCVGEVERKQGDLAGMDCNCPAGGDRQSGEIAEGMHHAGQAKADQQKDEGVAKAEGVVDGAGQHDR